MTGSQISARRMRRSAKAGRSGAPEWIVTFADLMSILVCFFVLIISFSIQDERKLQIVAGSMRDAFGVNYENRRTGVIEIHGAPIRDFIRRVSNVPQEQETNFAEEPHEERSMQGPEADTHDIEKTDRE